MNLSALAKQLKGGKEPPKGDPRRSAFKAFLKAVRDGDDDKAEAAFSAYLDDEDDDSEEE